MTIPTTPTGTAEAVLDLFNVDAVLIMRRYNKDGKTGYDIEVAGQPSLSREKFKELLRAYLEVK